MRLQVVPGPLVAGLVLLAGCGGSSGAGSVPAVGTRTGTHAPATTGAVRAAARRTTAAAPASRPFALHVTAVGHLPSPTQDPATTALPGGGAVLFGGLNQADVSVDAIVRIRHDRATLAGRLPAVQHDMAATTVGRHAYALGGGNLGSSDAILEGGRTKVAALPVPASDAAATTIGATAYIVGGYDGTSPLDTIVAWRPGHRARVVGHLPRPLRYAAVAAVGGRVLIAGGTSGTAARAEILAFRPSTGRVTRIGRLPSVLTHAAGAALDGRFVVLGGRGDPLTSQTAAILAIDPGTGRVRRAGRLPRALSDTGAATLATRLLVAGGRDGQGTVHDAVYSVSARWPAGSRPAPGPAARPRPASAAAVPRAGRVPPLVSHRDVYAADHRGHLSPVVAGDPARVYVPDTMSDRVDVIDQRSFRVIRSLPVGRLPQHVTPSWDLKTLWVSNDMGNSLTAIDPRTSRVTRTVPVRDPYNLYFTPDGRRAIVVAEALQRLDFRDPHTMAMRKSLPVRCRGVDHMDYTADGRRALISCEFSGQMALVDLRREKVLRYLPLRAGAMPQDVKLSPDGKRFFVADMASGGVWVIGARTLHKRFEPTGKGAHGLYVSRSSRFLFVSNRGEGTISVLGANTGRRHHKWRLPGGGSPDMGGVSASGRILWLSGRYDAVVYAISTRTGRLLHRIPVGRGPHGMAVWPQPGRYSIGHTGIMR